MKRFLLSLLLVIVFFAAGDRAYLSAQKQTKAVSVGMIALLASPQNYDGKQILTWGFLHIGRMPEEDSLWLRKEDGDFSLFKNSFALELSPEQRQAFNCVNHTYVLVRGTLRSDGPDTSSMNSGTIKRVTQLIGWSPYRPAPCELNK
ncbi:MAG: hypothetical protein ACM3JB_24885 [Acidobacteriaceae bacterium]